MPGFGRSAACSFGHGRGVSSLGDFSGRRGGLGDPIPKEMIFLMEIIRMGKLLDV